MLTPLPSLMPDRHVKLSMLKHALGTAKVWYQAVLLSALNE